MSSSKGISLCTGLALLAAAGCGQDAEQQLASGDAGAATVPLYDNLGSHHHEISASTAEVQNYFNQGLRLLYAFNHAESARAFRQAERLDSACSMCAWGVATVLGPNINAPMEAEAGAEAYAAAQRALAGAANVTPREQAFIRAIAQRYSEDPGEDRASLDSVYAGAMAEVAESYPDDIDAQVLYADALMNLSPWNYWTEEGQPRLGTDEIIARLEYSMKADPDHPGACHLFIHAEEAHDPARAVECAERLAALIPGAGHIVHMPGHVYIRVGRYADAIEANRHAVHADESYLEGPYVSRRGIYPQGYYPHNYHFMSFAASMAGNSETAIYAARKVAEKVGPEVAREIGWLEAITPIVYWTMVNFGQWDEILAEPLPPADLRFTSGQAYYARAVAFAAKYEWEAALTALDSVTKIAESFPDGDNKTALQIAHHALLGEFAQRRGDASGAIDHFRVAVDLEDGLTYGEPPTWYYPMRHSLGAALIDAGFVMEAEQVYLEDLERFPENGWSLYGLHQALEMQGRSEEAQAVKERFEEAWAHADVDLVASRF